MIRDLLWVLRHGDMGDRFATIAYVGIAALIVYVALIQPMGRALGLL